ncbi:hypothetical protein OPV22_015054 [Ensete ventricosum]|uniref:Pentatricopeptide repeat-containing protein n=1 Tax=Ensete ventricosum TaxID=4639 RepID=A0AAV8RB16_ENSVE|nr:hypothetical protein OPV22_015054 [Ensete ventricosum]
MEAIGSRSLLSSPPIYGQHGKHITSCMMTLHYLEWWRQLRLCSNLIWLELSKFLCCIKEDGSNPNVAYGILMRGYAKLSYPDHAMHVERMLFKVCLDQCSRHPSIFG